jgi:dTDP-4-amino-4,6-dideoxygalactose transaminase
VNPIYVTRPALPPLAEFIPYLEKIWLSGTLTNGGEMHQQFERALEKFLGVNHISVFNNGTIALMVALKALDIQNEVITTPYSFIATSHSLLWNSLQPVFCDISEETLNINPDKIEEKITSNTTAILAVHCYGNPCDHLKIKRIAEKNGLKIIYDAAHAFGVQENKQSILNFGDLSILSFHATKVFNTFEGGAIVSNSLEMKQHVDYLKNFGFKNEIEVIETGMNGKMSEFNAALGLLQLNYVEQAISKRKEIYAQYCNVLEHQEKVKIIHPPTNVNSNYSYFPVLFDTNALREKVYINLKNKNIYSRRYFFPLISNFPMYQKLTSSSQANLKVANQMADRILCLPIYPELTGADIEMICMNILQSLE